MVNYFTRGEGRDKKRLGRLPDGHTFEMGVLHDCDHPGCPARRPE